MEWHCSLEEYLAKTGEKANALAWCHKRAEEIYTQKKTMIDLPVIVIGAVNGFVSVGSTQIFQGWVYGSIVVGLISLSVSILNTMGSYFGFCKRAEGHRISSIQYSRLYRMLSVELGLPRHERSPPQELLKTIRDAYDRLQEISPLLPTSVIITFQTKFGSRKDISRPEELNCLDSITIYPPTNNDTPSNRNKTILTMPSRRLTGVFGGDANVP